MSRVPRFDTLRIGVLSFEIDGYEHQIETRILRSSDGLFYVLAGGLTPPLKTLGDAITRAENPRPAPPDVRFTMHWRRGDNCLLSGEIECFVCGAPVAQTSRYPRQSCQACHYEATDASGRSVRFANASLSGGLVSHYADDNGVYASTECLIRGIECIAEENRFGGIVILPRLSRRT